MSSNLREYIEGLKQTKKTGSLKEYVLKTKASKAADEIARLGNSWLDDSNKLIDGYNARYASGSNNYRADSSKWLDGVKVSTQRLAQDADSIRSLLGKYSGYYDPKWVKSVTDMLDSNLSAQNEIYQKSLKDREYWSKFKDEEDYKNYLSLNGKLSDVAKITLETAKKASVGDEAYNFGLEVAKEQLKNNPVLMYESLYGSEDSKPGFSSEDYVKKVLGSSPKTAPDVFTNGFEGYTGTIKQRIPDEPILKDSMIKSNPNDLIVEKPKYEEVDVTPWYDEAFELAAARAQNRERLKENYPGATDEELDKILNEAERRKQQRQAQSAGTGGTWFSSGGFDSDYPVESIVRGIGGTALDIVGNMGSGIIEIGENVLDTLGVITAGVFRVMENSTGNKEMQLEVRPGDKVLVSDSEEYFRTGRLITYEMDAEEWLAAARATEKKQKKISDELLDFVKKDLWDVNKPSRGVDDISFLGEKADSVAQSAGQMLATYGLAGMNIPWAATTAVQSFGSGAESALLEGSGLEGAILYGLANAATEILTEKLFKGSGLGEKGLFDTGKITKNISDKLVRSLADYGVDLMSEGAEEVVAEFANRLASKLYKEEDLITLLASDEAIEAYIDAFIGGTVISGFMNTSQNAMANASTSATYNGELGKGQTKEDKSKAQMELHQSLVTEALEIDPNNSFAKRMQAKIEGGKALSGNELRLLTEGNDEALISQDQEKIKDAVRIRLEQLGETEDVNRLADIIAKVGIGENITMSERKLLANSKYGKFVSDEIGGKYDSAWVKNIELERANVGRAEEKSFNNDVYALAERMAALEDEEKTPNIALNREAQAYLQRMKELFEPENAPKKETAAESKFEASETGKATYNGISLKNEVDVKDKISEDGKTVRISTGEAITIDKKSPIAKTEIVDGERKVYYNTDHGVVEDTDINYANEDDGLLYEAFSDMNPAFANAVIKNYDGSVSVKKYIDGMREGIFLYGMHNFQEVGKDIPVNSNLAELSKADQAFALKLGRAYAEDNANKADTSLRTAIKNASERAKASEEASTSEATQNKPKKGSVRFENGTRAKTVAQKRAVSLAKHLSRAIGIDIVFYDAMTMKNKNGKGANGYFDSKTNSIYLDLQNAMTDSKTIAFTLSHELVHFIKKWSPAKFNTFSKFLMEQYAVHGVSTSTLLANKMAKLGTTDADLAYEEMIADACERMLLDSNAVVKLMELRKADLELLEKIKLHVLEILNNIRDAFKGVDPNTEEGIALQKMEDVLGKIHEMFEDAVVDAAQNYQAGQTLDTEAVSVSEDGTIQMQMKQYQQTGRSTLLNYLTSQYGENNANDLISTIDSIYNVMAEIKKDTALSVFGNWQDTEVELNAEGHPVFTTSINNGDYVLNQDFSRVCKKRRQLDFVLNMLAEDPAFEASHLTNEDFVKINNAIKSHGFEIACALCFVDSKRFRQAEWADSFANTWNDILGSIVKDDSKLTPFNFATNNPNMSDDGIEIDSSKSVTYRKWSEGKEDVKNRRTYENFEQMFAKGKNGKWLEGNTNVRTIATLLRDHPELRHTFRGADIIASKGFDTIQRLAPEVRSILDGWGGSSVPKPSSNDASYDSSIINSKGYNKENAYAMGGVRMNSFSDFMAHMFFDYCQAFADLSAKELPSQAYTKELTYVRLFGRSGQKINMSGIAAIREGALPTVAGKGVTKAQAEANEKIEKMVAGLDITRLLEHLNKDIYQLTETDVEQFLDMCDYVWADESINMKHATLLQTGILYDKLSETKIEECYELLKAGRIEQALKAAGKENVDAEYAKHCGTIVVGVSDAHIRKLLRDPNVRMVIPYHKSGLNPIIARELKISAYNDYTDVQNTGVVRKGTKSRSNLTNEDIKKSYGLKDFAFYDWFGKTIDGKLYDGKATADKYLEWCEKGYYDESVGDYVYYTSKGDGYILASELHKKLTVEPKFKDFTGEENYYKLLEDFDCYNTITGEHSEQGAVDFLRDGLPIDYKGVLIEALKTEQKVSDDFKEHLDNKGLRDEIMGIVKAHGYTPSEASKDDGIKKQAKRATDKDYLDAVNRGDMETAQRMVDEAAKAAGYDTKAYHGTPNGGFTVFGGKKTRNGAPPAGSSWFSVSEEHSRNEYAHYVEWGKQAENPMVYSVWLELGRNVDIGNGRVEALDYEIDGKGAPSADLKRVARAITRSKLYYVSELDYEAKYRYNLNKLTQIARDNYADFVWQVTETKEFANLCKDNHIDSVTAYEEGARDKDGNRPMIKTYGVFYPEQIKSADPVTYDDEGNVIPLSERFNAENNDIRYQKKTTTNRTLLANALESTIDTSTQDGEIALKKLQEYKGIIGEIEKLEAERFRIVRKASNLQKKKGKTPDEIKEMKDLWLESRKIANRISVYDGRLLRIEAMKPIQKLLNREKQTARKEAEQKGREALAKYREKAAETQRELLTRYQESRKKGVEERRKTEMRRKIRKVVKDLNHLLNHGTKERNVKEGEKDVVASAISVAELLFSDDISNADIVRLGVDSATPVEEKLLEEYRVALVTIDSIDDQIAGLEKEEHSKEERYALMDNLEEARDKVKNKIGSLNQKLSDVFVRERARLNKAKVADVIGKLINEYSALENSGDDYIKNAYSENVKKRLEVLQEGLDGTLVRDMTLPQLVEVYDAYKMIEHMVRTSNNLFREGRMEDLMEFVRAVQSEIYNLYKTKKDPIAFIDDKKNIVNTFSWNNLKPVYAFDRLGSATFQKLYWDAVRADDDFAVMITEAGRFLQEQRAAHGYANWDLTAAKEFKLADGKVFKLTLEDMMSIYAYSKRDQADAHMTEGGFVFDENNTYAEKPFDGKKILENFRFKRKHAKLTETYLIDDRILAEIVGFFNKEENADKKSYVDAMQKYMTDMGQKGNEVSRALFGIDLFTDENYIQLKSSSDYLNSNKQALEKTPTQVSLKNNGTTKPTVPGANNPIVLRAFDELWLEHIDTMSKYCAYVLPIENLTRVFNNVSRLEGKSPMATKSLISAVFGNGAKAYFDQYITDLNGGISIGGYQSPLMAMFSRFKGTAVAAKLSVIVQQPLSIIRAMAMIRPDYFVPFLRGQRRSKDVDSTWEEIKKYAPIAILKEMGGYDIGSAGTTKDYIGITEYKRAKGKLKGLVKDPKYRKKVFGDAVMIGAIKMDELGWGIIWRAVKKEVATEQNLTPGTEEFFKAVRDRFTEVVVRTQVYDSVNSRSGLMRSKSDLNKFATSFMGEPTTVINMFYNAVLQAIRAIKSKDKALTKQNIGHLARTSGVLLATLVLTALAKAAPYANQDDDDDESWTERWMKHFGESLASDLNPLSMIPYTRDLVSIYEGWDIERPDMTLIARVVTSAKRAIEDGATKEEILNLSGDIANMVGLPAKNIVRDVKGIYNLISDHFDDITTVDAWGAFGRGWTGEEQTKSEALYKAIVNGDSGRIKLYKSSYKTDSDYTSAVRKALRDNDPRIKMAAVARYNGNIAEYTRIAKLIIAEKHFSQDDVVAAINAVVNVLKKKDGTTDSSTSKDSNKAISIYNMGDYYAALVGRDEATAYAVKEDIIKIDVANGKDRDDAEADFNSSFASHIRDLYDKGKVTDYEAKSMLVSFGGKTEKKATSRVQYWNFKQEYPDYDLSEEAVTKYYNDVEPSGIDVDVYYDYYKQKAKCEGTDANGDGKTDSGSVKSQVLHVINSMPLTPAQKDVLYYLNGWSKSTIWEAPWH